jgi:hypothetical protein
MIGDVLILERYARVAPLGVRLWDAPTARALADGLVVWAYPEGRPERRVRAWPNHSNIFVAHDLPGLREASFGDGDDDYWASVPRLRFVVEVNDASRNFQPFSFAARLPARGLASPEWGSPLSSPLGTGAVPLFSTPSRTAPLGTAVIRADLWDSLNDRPASWAVLEADYEGEVIDRGVADRDGRVVLIFAYPLAPDLPPVPTAGSPIGPPGRGPTRLSWPIRLGVRYTPWPDPVPKVPDLCRVLGQPDALFVDFPTATGELTLEYGRERVVASSSRHELLVNPAA